MGQILDGWRFRRVGRVSERGLVSVVFFEFGAEGTVGADKEGFDGGGGTLHVLRYPAAGEAMKLVEDNGASLTVV